MAFTAFSPSSTSSNVSSTPGFTPYSATSTPAPLIQTSTPKPGFFSRLGTNIANQFTSGVNQTKQAFSNITSGTESPLQGAESGLSGLSGIATAVTSPLAPILKPLQQGVGAVVNGYTGANGSHVGGIADIPLVQKLATSKAGQAAVRPLTDIANAGNVSGAIAGVSESPKLDPMLENTASNTIPDLIPNAKQVLEDRYVNQAKSDFTKPTEANTAGFKKPTQIFNNAKSMGNDIPQVLLDNGIHPQNITEDGKYNTTETADMLRHDTGQLSKDLLRPSLEQANYSTERVPVSDIIDQTKQSIAKNNGYVAEDKETLNDKLDKTESALKKQYPDGLNLTDLHDEKILRSANAKYNPLGTTADNLSADLHKELATTLKTTLEKQAPGDIPIKQFNAELQKRYQAADYLDSLNTKKVPTSLSQKIAQTTAKVIGSVIGEKVTGGGLLGGVGGYHLGGLLEKYVQNMPSPIKSYFLDNLERTNPKAFEQIKSTLNAQDLANATRPKLNAPEPLGTSKNPIITPAPTTYESAAKLVNRQVPKSEPAQLLLNSPTSNAQGVPIYLPKSISDVNSGLDEIKDATIRNTADRRRLLQKGSSYTKPNNQF